MGFLNETQTTVGSQAYNLAGEPTDRPNYIKTSVIAAVISESPSLGMSVISALLAGPGVSYKRFSSWADSGGFNDSVGNNTGTVFVKESISTAAFEAIVPSTSNKENKLLYEDIDSINLIYLSRQYIYANLPNKRDLTFTVTYENVQLSTGRLIITFSDLSKITFTPSVSILNTNNKEYVYIEYMSRTLGSPVVTVLGWTIVNSESSLPSVSSYVGSYTNSYESGNLYTYTNTLIEYSDETPDEVSNSSSVNTINFNRKQGTFTKTTFVGDPNSIGFLERDHSLRIEYYYTVNAVVTTNVTSSESAGVTKTTTVTTTTDTFVPKYRYRETWVDVAEDNWELSQMAVYEIGTVPSIDVLVSQGITTETGSYFPVIPIRKYSVFVDDEHYPAQYKLNVKASKKAFGKNVLKDVIKNLNSNADIASLNHAWILFGVSLGSDQLDGKEYIYQFFKSLADSTPVNAEYIRLASAYQIAWQTYTASIDSYVDDRNSLNFGLTTEPRKVSVAPKEQAYIFTTKTGSGNKDWAYNVTINASGGAKIIGNGYNSRSNNKVNTTWLYVSGNIVKVVPTVKKVYETIRVSRQNTETAIIRVGKQLTENTWEEYEFFDVYHTNSVYNGYTVITGAGQAITSSNENSSFIIPLNEVVFANTPLVRRTQLSLECAFLVINYYKVTDIPWYKTGIFKVVLIVIIIVIAVYTGYISGESLGMLGANAAVGATLGFVGTTAIIIGAIANGIAAAVVGALISKVSVAILGDTAFAHAVSFIATVAVMSWAANDYAFNMAQMTHGLTSAESLLKLTLSGVDTYSQYISGKVAGIQGEAQSLMTDYENKMEEIQKLSATYLNGSGIDPMLIAEATRYVAESPEQFMGRTLMLGDEIVEMTLGLVEEFPAQQLILPLN